METPQRRVGRYQIIRQIGRGGMAVVYLAHQDVLERDVALKELSSFQAGEDETVRRFLRESRLAGSLNHPNVVTVHECFEEGGIPYIAEEYLSRGTLRPYVGRLSLAQFAGVMEGVLAGLAHAEASGIVHRDMKPENLLVSDDGRVKITDFGIAKATMTAGVGTMLTKEGMAIGTPSYMAPEQAMASPDIGPWTDLYSVGVMAYEHLVGRPPFRDEAAPVILFRHVNDAVTPVEEVNPAVDPAVSSWVDRLLIKDPHERPQNAAAVWEELEEIVISTLGPRWRREARLMGDGPAPETPKPLTPAPFESEIAQRPHSGVSPRAETGEAQDEGYVTFGGVRQGETSHPAPPPEPSPTGPQSIDPGAPAPESERRSGEQAPPMPLPSEDGPAPTDKSTYLTFESGAEGLHTPEPAPKSEPTAGLGPDALTPAHHRDALREAVPATEDQPRSEPIAKHAPPASPESRSEPVIEGSPGSGHESYRAPDLQPSDVSTAPPEGPRQASPARDAPDPEAAPPAALAAGVGDTESPYPAARRGAESGGYPATSGGRGDAKTSPAAPDERHGRHRGSALRLVVPTGVILAAGLVVLLVWWAPWRHKRPVEVQQAARWEQLSLLLKPIEAAGVAKYGGSVWVVGGTRDLKHQPVTDVYKYRPGPHARWFAGPPLPGARTNAAVVSNGKQLYVIGGFGPDRRVENTVFRLDGPTKMKWKTDRRSLLEPRALGAAAWDGSRIVFAGGVADLGGVPKDDVWALGSRGWKGIGKLGQARDQLAAASNGRGTVWFIGGGFGKRGEAYSLVDVVRGERVLPGTPLHEGIRRSAAVGVGSGFCTIGGHLRGAGTVGSPDYAAGFTGQVQCQGIHDSIPPEVLRRAGSGATVLAKIIYVVGGYDPEERLGTATVQAFNIQGVN